MKLFTNQFITGNISVNANIIIRLEIKTRNAIITINLSLNKKHHFVPS